MPKINRLGSYGDVKLILDKALASGGGEVELTSYAEAIKWRIRAYRFRKLYAEQVTINSPYERLSFPRISPGSNKVIINFGAQDAVFHAKNAPGYIDQPEAPKDIWAERAAQLAKEVGISNLDDDPSDLGDEPL